MLEKHEVKIKQVTTKYTHTHTAFVEALNKILAERLFKVQEHEQKTEVRQPEIEAPLTKRQLKRGRNKDSKLAKKFKSLDVEISNLKSQMEALKDKITKASKSINAGFKRKEIRSMKREADKIAEKLRESEKTQIGRTQSPEGPHQWSRT